MAHLSLAKMEVTIKQEDCTSTRRQTTKSKQILFAKSSTISMTASLSSRPDYTSSGAYLWSGIKS
jgi:hypothetical protein